MLTRGKALEDRHSTEAICTCSGLREETGSHLSYLVYLWASHSISLSLSTSAEPISNCVAMVNKIL